MQTLQKLFQMFVQTFGRLLIVAFEVVCLDLLLAFLEVWRAGRKEILKPPKREWWAH